ncbi:oxidoreductase [Histidinibacterium lentulum]|uniref:Oxidoreductase n=2 Tax=Histidinibacterium lentulum TaxID=2480588 RepID=A0A3N2RAG2_9RHOB|nr:oxidoreductase [Histidinibacterium lentulum]
MTFGTTVFALEPVEEDVLLTVTGQISVTNADGAAEFDLPQLLEIAPSRIETTTIWTDGLQTFEGVELADLMALVGADGSALRAVALNDYAVDIPIEDAVEGAALVAYLRNGAPMSLRDKGPLWIVYPYDSSPEFQTEQIYSRSIWQLARIEVLP